MTQRYTRTEGEDGSVRIVDTTVASTSPFTEPVLAYLREQFAAIAAKLEELTGKTGDRKLALAIVATDGEHASFASTIHLGHFQSLVLQAMESDLRSRFGEEGFKAEMVKAAKHLGIDNIEQEISKFIN